LNNQQRQQQGLRLFYDLFRCSLLNSINIKPSLQPEFLCVPNRRKIADIKKASQKRRYSTFYSQLISFCFFRLEAKLAVSSVMYKSEF